MVFQIPESKRSIDQNKFEFQLGESTYKIDKAKYLPVGVLEAALRMNLGPIFDYFDKVSASLGTAMRELDTEQLEVFVDGWMDDSQVTPGESPAS